MFFIGFQYLSQVLDPFQPIFMVCFNVVLSHHCPRLGGLCAHQPIKHRHIPNVPVPSQEPVTPVVKLSVVLHVLCSSLLATL